MFPKYKYYLTGVEKFAKKVSKLYIAEAQFSNMMLNRLAKGGHKGHKNPQAMKKGGHPEGCAKQGDCK